MRLEVLEESGYVLELLVAVKARKVHLVDGELAGEQVVAEVGHLRGGERAPGIAATVQQGTHETWARYI